MASRNKKMETYGSRRDFKKTPEPPPGVGPKRQKNRIFVIQEHDASTHHYDLRLEIDGVLKSWAVPKGPSTDPSEKRLAVPTEDHPLKYADFEGVIPEDEYGGGTVIVWDAGIYRNLRENDDGGELDMTEAAEDGKIEVWLEGKKLSGGYALVKTGKERWLLVKMKDDGADARRKPTSTEPRSVISGRTLDEVAREESDGE